MTELPKLFIELCAELARSDDRERRHDINNSLAIYNGLLSLVPRTSDVEQRLRSLRSLIVQYLTERGIFFLDPSHR